MLNILHNQPSPFSLHTRVRAKSRKNKEDDDFLNKEYEKNYRANKEKWEKLQQERQQEQQEDNKNNKEVFSTRKTTKTTRKTTKKTTSFETTKKEKRFNMV